MKRLKNLLALCMAGTMMFLSAFSAQGAMYGDVNKDNTLTAGDASMILQYVLNIDSVKFSEEQLKLAKVNNQDTITASDAAGVLAKVLNDDYLMPVEQSGQATTKETTTQTTTKDITTQTTTKETTQTTTKDTSGSVMEKYVLDPATLDKVNSNEAVGDEKFYFFTSNASIQSNSVTVDGVTYPKAFKFSSGNKGIQFRVYGPAKVTFVYANGQAGIRTTTQEEDLATYPKQDTAQKVTYDIPGLGTYIVCPSGNSSATIHYIEVEVAQEYGQFPTAPNLKSIKTMERFGEVIYPDDTIVVPAGTTYDGKGVGVNPEKFATADQAEGGKPCFRLEKGATLKNVLIKYPSGDGVHCYGSGKKGDGSHITIENVHWEDIGEDAMTVKAAGDVLMYGCSAQHAEDKCFQINAETNYTFRYVYVFDVGKFLRQNGGTHFPITVFLDNVYVDKVKDMFMAADTSDSRCYYKNIYVTGCEDMWHLPAYEWTGDIPNSL